MRCALPDRFAPGDWPGARCGRAQDNINVRGLIYDVATGKPLKQYTVALRNDLGDAERKFDELADTLLVPVAASGRATLPTSAEGVRGTRSIPALTAYFHGARGTRRRGSSTAPRRSFAMRSSSIRTTRTRTTGSRR